MLHTVCRCVGIRTGTVIVWWKCLEGRKKRAGTGMPLRIRTRVHNCPVPCVELYLTALEGRGCMKLARSYNNYSYSYTQLVTEVVKAVVCSIIIIIMVSP